MSERKTGMDIDSLVTQENAAPRAKRRPKRRSGAVAAVTISCIVIVLAALSAAYFLLPRLRGGEGSPGTDAPFMSGMDTSPSGDMSDAADSVADPGQEVRGAYIATVVNINFPSAKGLSADELKKELDDIVRTAFEANLNALYFQVRPASDALYASEIFPASEYVSGTQGVGVADGDGELDILGYLVAKAHEKGIKVHAWVNPLRVTTGSASAPSTDVSALAESNPARQHPEWTVAYADGRLYYDPALPEVRKLVADGVAELAEKYDIDGVLFDDYFYPYPVSVKQNGKNVTAEFDDLESYEKYGGGADKADWRRSNVNAMIEECYKAVKNVSADCQFGIAPFGIWQNDDGENGGSDTSGFESYDGIYCDPTAWVEGGYVDYLAPQIYWRFSNPAAGYGVLVRWWNTLCEGTGVDLLISHGVYNYDGVWESASNELRNQIGFARSELAYRGSILYGWEALKKDAQGLLSETRSVFSEGTVYTGAVQSDSGLKISIPYSGSYIDGEGSFVIGASDPNEPLYLDGKKLGRTKSGYFSVYLPLKNGENRFVFTHKGEETVYVLNGGKQPAKPSAKTYAKLDGYKIASVTPSSEFFDPGKNEISVSVTAPSGSVVTATLGEKTITLTPTLFPPDEGDFMKEVYTGQLDLSSMKSGLLKNELAVGKILFTAKRGSATASAESGAIYAALAGTTLPAVVTKNDSELKISPNSWYYDDYTPQSTGARDNVTLISNGLYKLRCGGYISAENVELEGFSGVRTGRVKIASSYGLASFGSAEIRADEKYTYLDFRTDINVPVNCYIENGEFVLAVYNVDIKTMPRLDIAENPLFSSVRQGKSIKAYSYKFYLKLFDIENFYGFDHYYEEGRLVVRFMNPTSLPDTDKPLLGKVIVLDAGHGGKNPGALGPLGDLDGAMNESDFNLEIVMASKERLEALGAEVVLTRDRECEIDVPIYDRLDKLIEIQPDLCISIHQNSMPYTSDVTKIRGLVGLYWSDSGYMLTDVLGETMAAALDKLDRSPTKQRLAMVRNPKFPSTLIEVCFITNVEEYERMMRPGEIGRIADSLADGVLAYYARQERYMKTK